MPSGGGEAGRVGGVERRAGGAGQGIQGGAARSQGKARANTADGTLLTYSVIYGQAIATEHETELKGIQQAFDAIKSESLFTARVFKSFDA